MRSGACGDVPRMTGWSKQLVISIVEGRRTRKKTRKNRSREAIWLDVQYVRQMVDKAGAARCALGQLGRLPGNDFSAQSRSRAGDCLWALRKGACPRLCRHVSPQVPSREELTDDAPPLEVKLCHWRRGPESNPFTMWQRSVAEDVRRSFLTGTACPTLTDPTTSPDAVPDRSHQYHL